MRLTERKVCYPRCDNQGNLVEVKYIDIKDKKMAEEKLCQLEDIEERFGIDLITLFKALDNGVYVKHLKGDWRTEYLHKKEDCIEFLPIVKIVAIGMFYAYAGDDWQANYFTKDYGKTWALTKEELENEIY